MERKYLVEVVLTKEKLSNGNRIIVAHCPSLGITSQGKDVDEAMKNVKEAVEGYLEEQPERYDELSTESGPLFSVIEVTRSAKAASRVQ